MHAPSPILSLWQISLFPNFIKYANSILSLLILVNLFSYCPIVIVHYCHEYLMKMTSILQMTYCDDIISHWLAPVWDIKLIRALLHTFLNKNIYFSIKILYIFILNPCSFAPPTRWRLKPRNGVLRALVSCMSSSGKASMRLLFGEQYRKENFRPLSNNTWKD